jgi:hypothetical protein
MTQINQEEQVMTKKSNIEALIKEFEAQQSEFRKKLEVEMKKTFKSFFDEVTDVKTIIWTQYAPYFNDGDECIFHVHAATFTNATGEELENIHYGEYVGEDESIFAYGEDSYSDHNLAPETQQACDALDSLIQSQAVEAIFQALFGSHVKVTATAAGFDTEHYDHD